MSSRFYVKKYYGINIRVKYKNIFQTKRQTKQGGRNLFEAMIRVFSKVAGRLLLKCEGAGDVVLFEAFSESVPFICGYGTTAQESIWRLEKDFLHWGLQGSIAFHVGADEICGTERVISLLEQSFRRLKTTKNNAVENATSLQFVVESLNYAWKRTKKAVLNKRQIWN